MISSSGQSERAILITITSKGFSRNCILKLCKKSLRDFLESKTRPINIPYTLFMENNQGFGPQGGMLRVWRQVRIFL